MKRRLFQTLRSPYFRRTYFTFLAVFLGAGSMLVLVLYQHIRATVLEGELLSMKEKLVLLSPQARAVFAHPDYVGSQQLFPPKSQLSQTRYTLIAPRGEVIGDSHVMPETIVMGWSFPEVQEAIVSEWGVVTRKLVTHGEKALIVALALKDSAGTTIGVIRAELPLSTLEELVVGAQQALLLTALLGAGLAFLLGFVMTRRHAAPVAQLVDVCRAIQAGDFSQRVQQIPAGEMGQLARTINNLSYNVLTKISSLSLERAQLKSMLACMQEGILSLSAAGKIYYCNLAAYHHLDLSPEGDLRGVNITDIEGLEPVVKLWRQAAQRRELVVEEMEYWRRQGDQHSEPNYLKIYATFYESRLESTGGQGESGVMLVIDNHTEIKQLQNVRKEFFAHVSHELKTPLTSIAGYVETLNAPGTLQDEVITRRFLAKISSNTERLLGLVMDLLALTGLESKSQPVQKLPVQWLPVIRNVAENYSLQLEKKKIRLEVHKQYGGLLVLGNKEAMQTICENLLSNAIRYSKESSTIQLRFSKTKKYLYIHVVDTGVGIASEHLPYIFDRFYRVDKARSRAEGGTGLGLAIVKLFAERIGGTVAVESKLHQGTVFTVGLRRVF